MSWQYGIFPSVNRNFPRKKEGEGDRERQREGTIRSIDSNENRPKQSCSSAEEMGCRKRRPPTPADDGSLLDQTLDKLFCVLFGLGLGLGLPSPVAERLCWVRSESAPHIGCLVSCRTRSNSSPSTWTPESLGCLNEGSSEAGGAVLAMACVCLS